MFGKTTLFKYIFNEIWPTSLASLLVFTLVMIAAKTLNLSEWIVNHGVHPMEVGLMVFYLLPSIVLFALPAVTLIAVMIAFLRLSADNEILALKSSGVSLYQMVPPVALFSLMACAAALMTSTLGVPSGNRAFKDLIFRVAQSKADLGIKERVFCRPFTGVVFYVNSFSQKERVMRDVFVVDGRDAAFTHTIVAREGRIILHQTSRMITLQFLEGTVFTMERDLESFRNIGFNTYDLNIGLDDIMPALSQRKKSAKEMGIRELFQGLKRHSKSEKAYNEIMKELTEKFAIPAAVFFMGFIGLSLGAQIRGRGRFLGLVISLVVFFIYYLFVAGMRGIGEIGTIPPHVGMWVPDFFLCIVAVYLFSRAAKERSISFLGGFPFRRGHRKRNS
jgi:lipopolysaccharide export system permease protein